LDKLTKTAVRIEGRFMPTKCVNAITHVAE
jgi:hypothetical protein